MLFVEAPPALVVETFGIAAEVCGGKLGSFFDIRQGEDFASEVGFDDVLEPGEFGLAEKASTRANVGVDVAGVRGVLPPVGELVAVGAKNRIEAQRLNGILRRGES
jgi:hypothetical protein